jgi:hypothetical protein
MIALGMIVARAKCKAVTRSFMNPGLIVGILIITAGPLYGQAQQPNTAKVKMDARSVVTIISGDKLKTQVYCEMAELSERIDEEQDSKRAEELSQKIDELEQKLGPEFSALLDDLNDIDPDSQDGQEIGSIFETLDRLCEK